MIALSVNLNKIALIRNSRDTTNPDVCEHALMALDADRGGRDLLAASPGALLEVDVDHPGVLRDLDVIQPEVPEAARDVG